MKETADIIELPAYLGVDAAAEVQFFDYQISESRQRNKINLMSNTFSFLLMGTKEVLTHTEPVKITNSDFLLMKSGHCLMTENLSTEQKKYRSLLLFFSDDLLARVLDKYGLASKKQGDDRFIAVCAYDDFIRSFVEGLETLKELPLKTQARMLQVKIEEILLYLAEIHGDDFLGFLLANRHDAIQHFKKVIENNKLNKLTLKELAFLGNMSVSTFKREFDKHYHEPPIKWFQQRRLEHAAFLLEKRSKQASEIYEEVGYETLSNFIQAFKGHFGITPKQYQSKV